jgi:hypothetical protein
MSRPVLVLVLLVLAAVAGGLVVAWVGRTWRRWQWERKRRRGRQGEIEAPDVLAAAGYRVLEDQAELPCTLLVDGEPRPFTIRVDYLVDRAGRRYAAEVKTGSVAPDPAASATRRQLLEYAVHYPVEGAVLVDMEARKVHSVVFPALREAESGSLGGLRIWLGVVFGLGVLLGVLLTLGLR